MADKRKVYLYNFKFRTTRDPQDIMYRSINVAAFNEDDAKRAIFQRVGDFVVEEMMQYGEIQIMSDPAIDLIVQNATKSKTPQSKKISSKKSTKKAPMRKK